MSRFAVFISGGGTNLQALIDASQQHDFPGQLGLVISNKRDAYGLVRAQKAGIPSYWVSHRRKSREAFEAELLRMRALYAEHELFREECRAMTRQVLSSGHRLGKDVEPSVAQLDEAVMYLLKAPPQWCMACGSQ